MNNKVYVEWASHGDNGPYHGWVAAWDVANLTTSGFDARRACFNTSPNGGLAGIWQGGGRLAFEADGSAFYFETGNGSGGAADPRRQRLPDQRQLQRSAGQGRRRSDHDRHQPEPQRLGPQGRRLLHPLQRQRPSTAPTRTSAPARPLLLPDSAGIPGPPAPDGRRRQGRQDLPGRPRQHGQVQPDQRQRPQRRPRRQRPQHPAGPARRLARAPPPITTARSTGSAATAAPPKPTRSTATAR